MRVPLVSALFLSGCNALSTLGRRHVYGALEPQTSQPSEPTSSNASTASLGFAKEGQSEQDSHWKGPKIFVVGWKKTGTTSMEAAFKQLGLTPTKPPGHCNQEAAQSSTKGVKCLEKYVSSQDSPVCCRQDLIAALKDAYPEAKFILTERNVSKWTLSIKAWIRKKPFMKCRYGWLMGAQFGSENFFKNYQRHNDWVRELFQDSPGRL